MSVHSHDSATSGSARRPGRWVTGTRRGVPLLAAGLMFVPLTAGLAWPADAATVPGAITAVDLVETAADVSADMKLSLTWRVPDGSHAGDTFALTLPEQLRAVDGMTFPLKNAAGDTVAHAVVDGRTVTFTLTDFVETHTSVRGTAWFGVSFANTVKPGDKIDLTFTSGGEVFTDTVTATGVTGDYAHTATKWQSWANPATNNPPRPAADRILWAINGPRITKEFAGGSYTFTDTPGEGEAVDCDAINLFWGTSNTGGVTPAGWFGRDRYEVTCAPEKLVVTLKTRADDVGHIPGVLGWSAVTTPGLKAYRNSGSVRVQNGGLIPVGHVLKVAGGGDGDGQTPAPTGTGPTTTPPTTTSPGTTPPTTVTVTTTPTAPGTSVPGTTAPGTTAPTSTAPGTTAPGTTAPGTSTSSTSTAPGARPTTTTASSTRTTAPARPATPARTTRPTVAPAASAPGAPNRIDTGVPATEKADTRLVAGGLALVGLGGGGLLLLGRRRRDRSDRG